MQYHSEFNHHRTPSRDRTPWNIAERTGDDRVLPVFREVRRAARAARALPRASRRAAIATGAPLMRPLFFDHPDDPAVWEHPLQWMLGDDLLVAPVLEPGGHELAGLPARGRVGRRVHRVAPRRAAAAVGQRADPIDELPVYVRAERVGARSRAACSQP